MAHKSGNTNAQLYHAHQNRKDEFYTSLPDIENELKHYREHFQGKTVFCNCDDPYESNFFKYFAMHFNSLGLKKLIATCYDGSPIQGEQLLLWDIPELDKTNWGGVKPPCPPARNAYKVIITEVKDENGDGRVDLSDVEYLIRNRKNVLTLLEGNGDFRSEECIELLKEADVVVTNPPFSLFREYVAQLVEYGKKFLIIGHQNAITYKEIFPLIKNNLMWLGHGFNGGATYFKSYYEDTARAGKHKEGMIRVSGVHWFTNLDYKEHHNPLPLYKRYTAEEYPKYDNYDAIEVSQTKLIPEDYDGIMGVPITFLDKYCPEQFEILGITQRNDDPYKTKYYTTDQYSNANDLNARGVIIKDGIPKSIYARILIRKRSAEQ